MCDCACISVCVCADVLNVYMHSVLVRKGMNHRGCIHYRQKKAVIFDFIQQEKEESHVRMSPT